MDRQHFPQAKEQLESLYTETGITDDFDYLELPDLGTPNNQIVEGEAKASTLANKLVSMEFQRVYFIISLVIALFALAFSSATAQSIAPAPAPTSDGVAIDQGIAYVLMLLALALTYIMH